MPAPSTRPPTAAPGRLALLGALLGSLLLLAACGGPSATLGKPIPAVGGAPQPEPVVTATIGECRSLDKAAMSAASDNHPAVSCSAAHTALTYYVGTLHGDPAKLTSTTLSDCQSRYLKATGLSTDEEALTILSAAYYIPSVREYALGARQFRCDLVASGTYEDIPLPLPAGSTLPAFSTLKDVPDDLRLCRAEKSRDVSCSDPHVYRATGAFQIEGGTAALPPDSFFQAQGRAHCPALVSTHHYLINWPSKFGWEDKDRTMRCFSKVTD